MEELNHREHREMQLGRYKLAMRVAEGAGAVTNLLRCIEVLPQMYFSVSSVVKNGFVQMMHHGRNSPHVPSNFIASFGR